MEELGRYIWLVFVWAVFVVLFMFVIVLLWLLFQTCCIYNVLPFLWSAGETVVGTASEVIFRAPDDGSWAKTVLTPGLLKRGTILFNEQDDTEMIITGWAESSQSYVVRLGMLNPPKLTRRSNPPLLAAELLDPDDLSEKDSWSRSR